MSRESETIAGARECVAAMAVLESSAESATNLDATSYCKAQKGDAKTLASLFGPMTPRQEGAFRALAECIHVGITTGPPDFNRWAPFVGQTQDQIDSWIKSIDESD